MIKKVKVLNNRKFRIIKLLEHIKSEKDPYQIGGCFEYYFEYLVREVQEL